MATMNESNQSSIIPSDISPFSLDDLSSHISRILSLAADHRHQPSSHLTSDNSSISSEIESETVKLLAVNIDSI
jgi:hypothetical protein